MSQAAKIYWVVGGAYADRDFREPLGAEERIGPFADYEAAKEAWQQRAWATVDKAEIRYRIVAESPQATS